MKNHTFSISFRCEYPNGESTNHRQDLMIRDIAKWIEAYKFTHPDVKSISIKIWLTDLNINNQSGTITSKEEAQRKLIQKAINTTK